MPFTYPTKDITPQEYTEIIEAVVMVYRECRVTDFPLDCFGILRHYGFRVYSYQELAERIPELSRLCHSYTSDSFKWRDIIGYNERAYVRRIHFSLMHELGHHLLRTSSEPKADLFASHILAPRILIHRYRCNDATKIHDCFGLSFTAANHALSDYRRWHRYISYSARRPFAAELKLEAMFFPASPSPAAASPAEQKAEQRRPRRRRNHKKWREIEERVALLQEMDPGYLFRAAEYASFYGNDG